MIELREVSRLFTVGGQEVRAHARPGPRPAPPFDPNAPVQTNIRVGDGDNGPG